MSSRTAEKERRKAERLAAERKAALHSYPPDGVHVRTSVTYKTNPPTTGNHNPVPASDGVLQSGEHPCQRESRPLLVDKPAGVWAAADADHRGGGSNPGMPMRTTVPEVIATAYSLVKARTPGAGT